MEAEESVKFARDFLRLIVQDIRSTREPMSVRQPEAKGKGEREKEKNHDISPSISNDRSDERSNAFYLEMRRSGRTTDLFKQWNTDVFKDLSIDDVENFFHFREKENLNER